MKNIIIGNGFDLNLGLKTSYRDFMTSETFQILIKNNNSLAIHLSEKEFLNNWIDIEEELINYSQVALVNIRDEFNELKLALIDYLSIAQNGEIDKDSQAFNMVMNEFGDTNKIFNFNYTNSVMKILEYLHVDDALIEKTHSLCAWVGIWFRYYFRCSR